MDTTVLLAIILFFVLVFVVPSSNPRKKRAQKRERFDRETAEHVAKEKEKDDEVQKAIKTREEVVKAASAKFEDDKKASRGNGILQTLPSGRFISDSSESSYGFRNTVQFIRYYTQVVLIGSMVIIGLLSIPTALIEKSIREDQVLKSITTEIGLTRYCEIDDEVLKLHDQQGQEVQNPQGEYQCFVFTSDWISYPVTSIDFDGNGVSEQFIPIQNKATSQWYYIPWDLPMSYN